MKQKQGETQVVQETYPHCKLVIILQLRPKLQGQNTLSEVESTIFTARNISL